MVESAKVLGVKKFMLALMKIALTILHTRQPEILFFSKDFIQMTEQLTIIGSLEMVHLEKVRL